MASVKAHGVVMVYTNTRTIHDPEKGHVDDKPTVSDWEMFPSLVTAVEAGHTPCGNCFFSQPGT